MATYSSTLAWNIPWMEEPGRLQSMGSWRVRHDWKTSHSHFTFKHWRRKWQPNSSVPAWRIPGTGEPGGLLSVESQSQTWLKRLSSSINTSSSSRVKSNVFILWGSSMICCCCCSCFFLNSMKKSNEIKNMFTLYLPFFKT